MSIIKVTMLALLCSAAFIAGAAGVANPADEKPAPAALADVPTPTLSAPAPADPAVITDAVIKKVVREMIAEDPRPLELSPSGQERAFSGGVTQAKLSAAFDQAKVPDCLHPDALKHQPAQLGPITVVGPYSLPWIISAALRGKCN